MTKDKKKAIPANKDLAALQSAFDAKQGGGVSSSLLSNAGVKFQAPPAQTPEQRFMAAQALHKAGNLDEAEKHYKALLKQLPQNAKVLALYGMLLKQKERWSEAQRLLKKSLRLNPQEAEAHNGLGMVLRHLGKSDEAIASFKKAAELDPAHPGPINNMGIVYREIGEFEKAAQCFEETLAIDPNVPEAWHGLAQTRKNTGDKKAIEHLKNLVKTAQLDPGAKRHAALALGKFCDAAGMYEDAFHYFEVAKSDRRNPEAWTDDYDLMKRVAEIYTEDAFPTLAHTNPRDGDPTPVFILGMPRSGTTLVEQIMASHPNVKGGGELQFFRERTRVRKSDGITRIPDYPEGMQNVGIDTLGKIKKDFFREFKENKTKKGQGIHAVTDKTPFNFFYLGLIAQVLPDAKIVHCMRNPIDTILSIFFTDFSVNFPFTEDLMAIGREYAGYWNLMAHWRKHLPMEVYELSYEDLIDDQETMTRELIDFCGLPWDDRCLSYHETKRQVSTPSDWQVRQPIYRGSVERWRNYEKQLEPVIKLMRDEGIVD